MQVVVNDRPHDVAEGMTVAELLQQLQLNARHVAVEVNARLVPRAAHGHETLHPGDRLEVVTLVGGG